MVLLAVRCQGVFGWIRTLVLCSAIFSGFVVSVVEAADRNESIETILETLGRDLSTDQRLTSLLRLSDLYREEGRNRLALDALREADRLASNDAARAETLRRQGGVQLALGRLEDATSTLTRADALRDALSPASRIALFLDLGTLAVEREALDDAERWFAAAAEAAAEEGLATLEAKARLNRVRAQIENRGLTQLESRLAGIATVLGEVPEDERAPLLLSLGELYQRSVTVLARPERWRSRALSAYEGALDAASGPATRGYAYGFLGSLYEDEGRFAEAATLTRKAIFHAQQVEAAEQTYRWEWQLGRVLEAQGELSEAQAALSRAVEQLDRVKPNFPLGSRGVFATRVAPVYTQYADVLLARSGTMPSGETKQAQLRKVRDLLERLKQAEVEDYFANECVVENSAAQAADAEDGGAAVLYPVLLEDRLELLVESGGTLSQYTTPVGRNQVTQAVRRFRINLENARSGDAHLEQAQNLYRWLIAPLEKELAGREVDTLVIVPEGPLRTIPLAALHDGRDYLIASYAVAVTPGLQLTQQLRRPGQERLLVGGLSESVQGFAELPAVRQEVDTVASIYPAETFTNESFRLEPVRTALQSPDFTVAHFATHGEFSADHRQSFLLTYDDRLTLARLQETLQARGSDAPLDLLVLSACKTAAGDDRAALGLAGVAVQAGAQSALASLWYISDAATAALVDRFYRELRSPEQTKAESLRAAQLSLLASGRFEHPSYWAPYLLIGNWL